MNFHRTLLAAAFSLGALSLAATAATAPGAGPVQPSETKTFADWTVRCFPVNSLSPCDMFEMLANKQTGERVMSLSLAYMPAGDKHVIQIAVPLGVSLKSGATIQSDAYTSQVLPYRRCDRGGCYVEMLLGSDAVTALSSSNGSAKIRIVADGGKAFEIPFSLKGFADAHGAMVDLSRKKIAGGGKPAPEAPAPAAPATAPAAPAPADNTPAPATP